MNVSNIFLVQLIDWFSFLSNLPLQIIVVNEIFFPQKRRHFFKYTCLLSSKTISTQTDMSKLCESYAVWSRYLIDKEVLPSALTPPTTTSSKQTTITKIANEDNTYDIVYGTRGTIETDWQCLKDWHALDMRHQWRRLLPLLGFPFTLLRFHRLEEGTRSCLYMFPPLSHLYPILSVLLWAILFGLRHSALLVEHLRLCATPILLSSSLRQVLHHLV